MKKHICIFLFLLAIFTLLPACKHSVPEIVFEESTTVTEDEEETVEEYNENGEKIITFKFSKEACDRFYGKTIADTIKFINDGMDQILEDDFLIVTDKNSYLELKMSEDNIDTCKNRALTYIDTSRKKMLEFLEITSTDGVEKKSFFSYNTEYNELTAYISREEYIDASLELSIVYTCLEYLQILDGVRYDKCDVHVIIINPETSHKVTEFNVSEGGSVSLEDWE